MPYEVSKLSVKSIGIKSTIGVSKVRVIKTVSKVTAENNHCSCNCSTKSNGR